ncbi:hypothetical protein GX441_04780 [bacterium]|nr:hypothetical protein [bacterium]
MKEHKARAWLRAAYILGALIDAVMVPVMLIPELARVLWGFSGFSPTYRYAMMMGAALMLGWTLLLIWACIKPIERRGVALLTIVVILGIAAANIYSVITGLISASRMILSWVMQAILAAFFTIGYFGSREKK